MSDARQASASRAVVESADIGGKLVALAGAGLSGYSVVFLVRNFAGLIELGLGPEQVGVTPDQVEAFSPQFYHYISHVQTALAGLLIALGIAVAGLAWYGIRRGERWALGTAVLAVGAALVVALPLHYPYGFDTLGHLGPIYADAALLLAGVALAVRGLRA